MAALRVLVDSELAVIRAVLDLANLIMPVERRIQDTEYKVMEGFVMARRELGTVSTQAAIAYICRHVGKPDMKRRSFANYRNSLVEKGWLRKNGKEYELPRDFDFHQRTVRESGEILTVLLTIERVPDGVDFRHTTGAGVGGGS